MSEFTLGESMGGQTKVDKWNEKTIFRGTGAEIAAASTNVKVMICTSTGSGYTANHVYFRKADNSIVDIGVVDQAETISGLYTFDRGASQAPFAVAQASALVVTNLDADKLDGKHVSDLGMGADVFGDGSDGDVTISSNTTLTETKFYNSLTVNSGIVLNPGGYIVHVKGALTLNGTINRKGNNGSGTSGGAALSDGDVGGSYAGGNAAQNGSGGNGLGGNGGRGRDASNNPNGTLGGTITLTKPVPRVTWLLWALMNNKTNYRGGAGGGGGNGSGGGGGSGGGVTPVLARTVTGSGIIDSEGGDAAGNQGGSNNGGGDGGGGFTFALYEKKDAGITIRARRGQSYLDNGAQDGRVVELTTK